MTLRPVDSVDEPVLTPMHVIRLSTQDVCTLSGLSYRSLDFGIRCGYYECENEGAGSGSRRSFTLPQLRRVLLIAWLTSGGLTPSQAAGLVDGNVSLLLAAWPGDSS